MGLNSVKRRKDKDLIYSLQSLRIGIFPSQCYNIVGMPISLLRPQHTRTIRATALVGRPQLRPLRLEGAGTLAP